VSKLKVFGYESVKSMDTLRNGYEMKGRNMKAGSALVSTTG
jgi:hypothetical protein